MRRTTQKNSVHNKQCFIIVFINEFVPHSTEKALDHSKITIAPPERDRSASVSLPPTPIRAQGSRERRANAEVCKYFFLYNTLLSPMPQDAATNDGTTDNGATNTATTNDAATKNGARNNAATKSGANTNSGRDTAMPKTRDPATKDTPNDVESEAEDDRDLAMGSSRATGGLFRGKALGNCENIADMHKIFFFCN